jgi:hypothetical protein
MKNLSKKLCVIAAIAVVIMLAATLPFHYFPEQGRILTKDHLTFANTIVTYKDMNKILQRFNEASAYEKEMILSDPWVIKLTRENFITFYDPSKEQNKNNPTTVESSPVKDESSKSTYDYIMEQLGDRVDDVAEEDPIIVEEAAVEAEEELSVSDLIPEPMSNYFEGFMYWSHNANSISFALMPDREEDHIQYLELTGLHNVQLWADGERKEGLTFQVKSTSKIKDEYGESQEGYSKGYYSMLLDNERNCRQTMFKAEKDIFPILYKDKYTVVKPEL